MPEHIKPQADHRPPPPAPAEPIKMERPAAKPIEERWFYLREMRQNEWFALVTSAVTPEDLLRHDFWAMVRDKLNPGCKVIVFSENRRLYTEMICFSVDSGGAEMRFLAGPILVAAEVANRSIALDYEIRDLGEIKKWGVVRVSDGKEIKADGTLRTSEDANRWLAEFLRMETRKVA